MSGKPTSILVKLTQGKATNEAMYKYLDVVKDTYDRYCFLFYLFSHRNVEINESIQLNLKSDNLLMH